MDSKNTALWLIVAVALGLFVFSITAILVNGFRTYMVYTALLGIVNLVAFYLLHR